MKHDIFANNDTRFVKNIISLIRKQITLSNFKELKLTMAMSHSWPTWMTWALYFLASPCLRTRTYQKNRVLYYICFENTARNSFINFLGWKVLEGGIHCISSAVKMNLWETILNMYHNHDWTHWQKLMLKNTEVHWFKMFFNLD